LHGFIKDLCLQWMARNREIEMVPQALLRRHLSSNPTVLNISTCNQRNPFSPAQLTELDDITKRRASPWLHSEGTIFRGTRAGSYDLLRSSLPEDKVSVIIPFRNQADMTRVCVLSLLEHETTTKYEIILIDNGSTEPEAVELSSSLKSSALSHDINLIGIRDESPFNFSAINNRARSYCSGNFLLFLNNDIRFESRDPLQHLLNPFALKCTGAVSSRLMYEDGSIQHNGLVAAAFQSHDILSAGKGLHPGSETDSFAALTLSEQWSAATAACLLVRSEEFDCIGGFDEKLSVAYNDVDLCWRLAQRNLAVVVTPLPSIIHSESKSRGEDVAGEKRNRLAKESGTLRDLYPKYFRHGDPLYNCFLDPSSQQFDPADMPIQPIGKSRSRILYSWTTPDFKPGDRPFVIYVHYDPNGEVRPDIFAQLEAYRCYSNVAFVSASPLLIDNTNSMEKLRDISDIVLVRHNEGYDFGSWQAAILFCKKYLQEVSQLILTNDSCYGPFYDLSVLFQRLYASNADVIGLTDSTAIHHHLQSYFIAYNRRILSSPLFWSFWNEIQIWPSKVDLVRACEVGWSDTLVKAGFQLEALYLEGEHGNVTHTHWRQLLVDCEFPFIKTELLRLNPILQDINGWYEIASKLNPRIAPMIVEHLARSSN
jgi:GT2 family glycosyltransferase